jgi:hypothetical protein
MELAKQQVYDRGAGFKVCCGENRLDGCLGIRVAYKPASRIVSMVASGFV